MNWAERERPIRATNHCKHYSYELGLQGGPRCAVGCDLAAGGSTAKCMPEPNCQCDKREDYTDAERAAWKEHVAAGLAQGVIRAGGIVEPIPCYTDRSYDCPCGHGQAHVARGAARAYVTCSCGLSEMQYNIGHNGEWPKRQAETVENQKTR